MGRELVKVGQVSRDGKGEREGVESGTEVARTAAIGQ